MIINENDIENIFTELDSKWEKVDDSSNDYQLSRAFDLILALDLANNN